MQALTVHDVYGDEELAALYDLTHAGYDDDLPMYAGFAAQADGPILELCAGSGRIAVPLARSGHELVALDSSPFMLERLRRRAEPGAPLETVEADIRDFRLDRRFALIICALYSFEQMLTHDDAIRALRCVAQHLAPDGRFVCELRTLATVEWSGKRSRPAQHTGLHPDTGETIRQVDTIRASAAAQTTTTTVLYESSGDIVRRVDVTLRVFGREEFVALLAAAGLRPLAVYGGTDLSPLDDAGDTMVFVAGPA